MMAGGGGYDKNGNNDDNDVTLMTQTSYWEHDLCWQRDMALMFTYKKGKVLPVLN